MLLILSLSIFTIVTTLFILDMNKDQNINSNVSTYFDPLFSETIVTHNYAASPELVWQEITKLSDYNFWFPGILRILPVVNSDRFVHQYSFDKFQVAQGSTIKVRPFSVSPLDTVPELPGLICSVEVDPQSTPSPTLGSKFPVVIVSAVTLKLINNEAIKYLIIINPKL